MIYIQLIAIVQHDNFRKIFRKIFKKKKDGSKIKMW